jgi:putative ABC transport system substrate-binding protein
MPSPEYTKHQSWQRPASIGFLGATSETVWAAFVAAFEKRLHELGWIKDHNIKIHYRWGDGRHGQFAKIAKDFVQRGVDVIVTGGTPAVLAAKKATKSIPIVFATAGDPVGTKLVASMKRPGGNVTGISNGQTALADKRLDLLLETIPGLKRLAILANPASQNVRLEIERVQRRAKRRGLQTVICNVQTGTQIGLAIKRLKGRADALYVCTDPLITHHRIAINIAAASMRLPTMHAFRDYIETGGLISYGPNFRTMFATAAEVADKILRGGKPADIPVHTEKNFELVVNLETARMLDLKIPNRVRRRAHAVQ